MMEQYSAPKTQKNRNSMMAVYYANELRHHGVQGMSWGERNGPPYPLGGLDKKVARAEAKRKKARERALEKARKAAKKKRKAEARDARREERAARQEEKDQILKEKLLRKGNLDDIRRHKKLFTTQELSDAIVRARILEEVKSDKKKAKEKPEKPEKPKKSAQEIMNDVTKFATTVNAIGAAALTTKNLVDGIVKMNRDKELHQLAVEAKELTNLKLAVGARDAGANPKDSYFRAEKKIDAPANAYLPSKSEGGSAKVDVKPEKAPKKPDSTTKEAAKELPKSVRSVLPQELIDAFSSESSNARTTVLARKKFFGLLGKTTQTTPEFWDSVSKVKVDQMYKKSDSKTPTKTFHGRYYNRDVYDTDRIIDQERRATGGSSLTEKKQHASSDAILDLYSPDAETSRKSWLAPYALELTAGSEKLAHDIEKMIEPLRGIKLN